MPTSTYSLSNTQFKLLYSVLFFIGLALSFIYAQHQIVTTDQIQMILNGYRGAYTGNWSSYGNISSVVGNIPGSFSSLVVGLPVLLWDSPWSPMLVVIIFHIISLLLFDAVIKEVFNSTTRIVFLVLYWLNPWFLFENILYNPAYLSLFTALHFYSAFKLRHNPSFVFSFLHIFSIGMAMQLHYSWPVLAVLSAYLLYRNSIKINWFGLISGGVFIFLTLVPYLQEYLANEAIRQNKDQVDSGRYIGWGGVHVYPVLKAFLYWFRFASTLFTHKITTVISFDWLGTSETLQILITYVYRGILYLAGIASLWLVFLANKMAYQRVKNRLMRTVELQTNEEWLLFYMVGVLIGVFISAILSPIIFSYWHLMIIAPFSLIPLIIYLQRFQTKKYVKYFWILAIYFVVVNLVAAHDSYKFSYKQDYSQQINEQLEQMKLVKL